MPRMWSHSARRSSCPVAQTVVNYCKCWSQFKVCSDTALLMITKIHSFIEIHSGSDKNAVFSSLCAVSYTWFDRSISMTSWVNNQAYNTFRSFHPWWFKSSLMRQPRCQEIMLELYVPTNLGNVGYNNNMLLVTGSWFDTINSRCRHVRNVWHASECLQCVFHY